MKGAYHHRDDGRGEEPAWRSTAGPCVKGNEGDRRHDKGGKGAKGRRSGELGHAEHDREEGAKGETGRHTKEAPKTGDEEGRQRLKVGDK